MKTFLPVFLSLCLTSVARGALLYFDNFSQFPNGTVLTETNYVPTLGISPVVSAFTSTNNGNTVGASAVATNLLGGIRLFANVPAGAQAEYDARLWGCGTNLSAAVTNQVVTITWLSWIATTKSLAATGALAVGLSATNLDTCCNGSACVTNLEPHVPLLFFNDSGSIYVLTNVVTSLAGPFPIVQIGSWSNYAGQIMTNALTLNYPARQFSFSLNGTVLTNNMTLPAMCTNILTEVDLYGAEMFPTSVGNQFALDDVQLSVPLAQGQNLFVSDNGSGNIYEFMPNGGSSTFAFGLNGPRGLAFNSAGDLFVGATNTVGVTNSGNIYEFTPNGGSSTFASGLNGPRGLAFNSAGNLFVADQGSGSAGSGNIYEFTPNGGSSTFASGLNKPRHLAFNSAGNLFEADDSGNIYEFTPNGGSSTFASGLDKPRGLAFNGAGNLFVADSGSGNIYEFTSNGGSSTFASGLNTPYDLAFNSAGNLFEADQGSGNIYEFMPNGGSSTFASGLDEPWGLAFQGITLPPAAPPLQITSITQTGNSIAVSWNTGGIGSTNELQATAGTATGGYATNNFATIFAVTNVVGLSTNYLDGGGATNRPARYYRVKSP
jgi:hypothetical protein